MRSEGLPPKIHEFLNGHLHPFFQEIAVGVLRITFRNDLSQFELDIYSVTSWESGLKRRIRKAYLAKNFDLADKLETEYDSIKEERYPTLPN